MEKININQKRILKPLCLLLLGVALGTVIYYLFGPSLGEFHADCTDTLYWANASYESGRWISQDFYYAALLPAGGNLLMLPFLPFFGMSLTSHRLGMLLFILLFCAALWWLFRCLGNGREKAAGLAGIALLLCTGSAKLRELFFGHIIYYSLGPLLLILGVCLSLRLMEAVKGGKMGDVARSSGLLALCAWVSALNGAQILALSGLPVILALVALWFSNQNKPLLHQDHMPIYFSITLMITAICVGTLLLMILKGDVRAAYADAYSLYSSSSAWVSNALLFPEHWFTLIGVDVMEGDPFISVNSVFYLLRMAVGIAVLVIPVVGLVKNKHLRNPSIPLLLWAHLASSAVVLFGYICGDLSVANWRLTPIWITGVCATLSVLADWVRLPHTPFVKRLPILVLTMLLLCSSLNIGATFSLPLGYGKNESYAAVAQDLQKNGLTYGYATFWNSQTITVLSGESVQVRNVEVSSFGVLPRAYQTSSSWYQDQPGVSEYFILLTSDEYQLLESGTGAQELQRKVQQQWSSNGFQVLVFDENPFSGLSSTFFAK